MKSKSLLVFLMAALLVVSIVFSGCAAPAPTPTPTPAPAQEVYEWRMQSCLPKVPLYFEAEEAFVDSVEKASGGRIQITKYGAGEIVPVLEQWEAVSTGVLDLELSYSGYWFGKTLMAAFLALHFPGTITTEDAFAIQHGLGIEDLVREAYAEHNIALVGCITPEGDGYILSKVPIRTVADFEGLKIRTTGVTAEVLEKIGAAPVYFPSPEIYGALETGVVDAVYFGPISVQVDMGFHEVTEYILMPPINHGTGGQITMNLDTWLALPDDLKEILRLGTRNYVSEVFGWQYLDDVTKAHTAVEEFGLTKVYMPAEEMAIIADATKEVYDEFAAEGDPRVVEAWGIVKDYLALK